MPRWDDPPDDGCEKCLEAGLEECQCTQYNPHDPLDNPAVLGREEEGNTYDPDLYADLYDEVDWLRREMHLMSFYRKDA